jgi:hypothetical protein
MTYCIYSTSCNCVTTFFDETGRPLAMQLHEQTISKRSLLQKSKLPNMVMMMVTGYAEMKPGFWRLKLTAR